MNEVRTVTAPFPATADDAGLQSSNSFARVTLYVSIFAIPFSTLYLPGTGDRFGVVRAVHLLLLLAIMVQPSACIRRLPVGLALLGTYSLLQLGLGLTLTPDLQSYWGPSLVGQLEKLFWAWFMFNVLLDGFAARGGLWALMLGCTSTSILHLLGIGMSVLPPGMEGRSTVFGANANIVAANYGTALICALGLVVNRRMPVLTRCLSLPIIGLLSAGLLLAASRTAVVVVLVAAIILAVSTRWEPVRWRPALILASLALLIALPVIRFPTLIERMQASLENDPAEEPRVRMYPVLMDIFLRAPLLGQGPDRYREELTWRATPTLIQDTPNPRTISAHNLVLRVLVETGLLGFLVYGSGIWLALSAAWRARSHFNDPLPLAMLAPWVLASMISCDPQQHPVYWLVLAYAFAGRGWNGHPAS